MRVAQGKAGQELGKGEVPFENRRLKKVKTCNGRERIEHKNKKKKERRKRK